MPEYLAPGVYVEETSFRPKTIEGVSTTTTGFIGPTRYGPLTEPDIITSLAEFERVYGDRQKLKFSDGDMDNYMWHAARAFFAEGGKRLYISRIYTHVSDSKEGYAKSSIPDTNSPPDLIEISARFPGESGNMRVRFKLEKGQNIFSRKKDGEPVLAGIYANDIVWVEHDDSSVSSPPGSGSLYIATYSEGKKSWVLTAKDAISNPDIIMNKDMQQDLKVHIVTLNVTVFPTNPDVSAMEWKGLPLDPAHSIGGSLDSFSEMFAENPSNKAYARTLPIVIDLKGNIETGIDVLEILFGESPDLSNMIKVDPKDVLLIRGNDGKRPDSSAYEGKEIGLEKTGLKAFEDIEDISIVAAPGSTYKYEYGYKGNASTIINLLISHAKQMCYRIAVLDSGDKQTIAQVRDMRAKMDSTYAAVYYPWVSVLDPVTKKEINLPPSGFVAGIYARNDINRGVYKAPANEVVNLAIGFEQILNKGQQDVLNPEGINCFRFFEGRGYRLWGARTISSDPEWKYVNLRRYFIYLERSIDRGTQWAVFEPNGEALWGNVRRTIEDFLLNEWQSGALLGEKPEKAFFVRCDRSTMTQNDIDNGRMIALIGVAPLRPAEFVIFRIGQWTADRRS